MSDLPDIIRLSTAVIDRIARLVIEWDEDIPGKIHVDNGRERYFYEGDDAKLIWDFYHPEKPENWR